MGQGWIEGPVHEDLGWNTGKENRKLLSPRFPSLTELRRKPPLLPVAIVKEAVKLGKQVSTTKEK